MPAATRITPFLWFAHEAEEPAALYTSIFPNSRITNVARYGETGEEVTGGTPGSVMTVSFELDGQPFVALNGRAGFDFTEAVSFQVACVSQAELDHFWDRLSAGADPAAQQCGWLKDRFGLSWQVIPRALPEWVGDPGSDKCQRAMRAMLQMKKIDMDTVYHAYHGSA